MKEIQIKAYMCDKCGKIYTDKYLAEICCKQYYCEKCGKPTPKYSLECNECKEKRIYDNATKMTYEEYIKKYPGYPIVDTDNGEFFWELEDYIDFINNETEPPYPTYCFGTFKERLEIDIEDVINSTNTNADAEDDCGLEPTKDLIDFIDNWNKENGRDLYYCNQKIVILIDKEDYQK